MQKLKVQKGGSGTMKLEVAGLKQGIYYLRIISEEKTITQKVIISR